MADSQETAPVARLELVKKHLMPVSAQDTMPEAGRKILAGEFVKMLKVEEGSRTGADIENVHKMRVAIRRMRSAFRLLRPYYKTKVVNDFNDHLRRVMTALGSVRDLDVLIHDLTKFQASLNENNSAILQGIIEALDQRRVVARQELNQVLDSKSYRRFQKDFTKFLITEGAGVRARDENDVTPYQVQHVLALLIYKHLAVVRAYETVLDDANAVTLHDLRIEFKRLRYLLSLFSDVLSKEIDGFVKSATEMQDHLGRLNDIHIGRERLHDLMDDLEGDQRQVLNLYLEKLAAEKPKLEATLPDVWRRFNSKTVQRKLASAVAAL